MNRDLFSDEKRSSRDFLDLTLKALRELDRTDARRGFVPCFKLWDYGPHQPFRSWLIQVPEGHREETIVLERRWDAPGDRERLSRDLRRRPDLRPTLSAREAEFPREDFDSLRGFARRIEFPLLDLREAHLSIPPAPYGIEGCRRDAVRLRTDRVRLEWGAVPPAELKGVAAWVARVRSLCESCFPDSSVAILRAGPTGLCSLCRRACLDQPYACPACGARYHADCWDYVGLCAVYGCGGRGEP
jgi:hypothetical protein